MSQSRKERMKKDPPDTYGIIPDYWKEAWGSEPPVLGFVSAYSEFEAVRQAYTRKLLPKNFTIQPHPVKLTPQEAKKWKSKMRSQRRGKRRSA